MNLEKLYDEYVERVYKFFYIQCLDRHAAEDLTSQTFYVLVEKSKTIQIDDHKKYLYGIMRNVWYEFLRNKYKYTQLDLDTVDDFEIYVEDEINDFQSNDAVGRLIKFVEKLPASQKKVIIMRHYEEHNPKQIAKILGKDINYVKVTYKRAIKSLRKLIISPQIIYGDQGVAE